jgi:putative DNA primase/helicase
VNAAARSAIPAELQKRRQWVVWRREERDDRPTKVPYRAGAPRVRASSTDARTWGTFEQALHALENRDADGVGFVFDAGDPFCGIDLDGCREPGGVWNANAQAIVDRLDSYTEMSPSGDGLHVIVRARLDGGRCRRGPVEMYGQGRYFTITGVRVDGVPHAPMPRQRELDELRARLFPPPVDPRAGSRGPRDVPQSDRGLLERAFAASNGVAFERLFNGNTGGYGSHSEADLALCAHLAYWTGGDPDRIDQLFRTSSLMRDKWERIDYRERTIAKALS